MEAFDDYHEEHGPTGGWHPDDHSEFERILKACKGDYSHATLVCYDQMIGFKRADIIAHARCEPLTAECSGYTAPDNEQCSILLVTMPCAGFQIDCAGCRLLSAAQNLDLNNCSLMLNMQFGGWLPCTVTSPVLDKLSPRALSDVAVA